MASLIELEHQEQELQFSTFSSDVAWDLGVICRGLAQKHQKPVVIHIASSNSGQLLFHACSRPGTTPDNAFWVKRKQATVFRFGCSSYYMKKKMDSSLVAFETKYALSEGDYAANGGGFPIRVKGVEGTVAVVVISGLSQEEDHELAVEGIRQYLQGTKG
ncbi:hypothetical protein P167DRAFT_519655 [Morchella conica CCBAS932]|uniref:DUF336-domain-containing protein n=1 Tax=Morchella conica CCBAS932 TaxID=1392247 RepID=A0A3N4L9Z4_9PEZI|nr:hypothetical protein P167DRAFT_519655 [Morchella conica CCBAS932]